MKVSFPIHGDFKSAEERTKKTIPCSGEQMGSTSLHSAQLVTHQL
jgi:hypothetical protein